MRDKEAIETLKKTKIVLASSSPRRINLLKKLGLKFKVVKSNINESKFVKKLKINSYTKLVKLLSLAKVISVVSKNSLSLQRSEIICGFDTMVICNGKIIEKPKSNKDALNKLLFLSGKEHKVYTGICIVNLKNKKVTLGQEATKVKMKKISKREAINYIKTGEPFGKAGAYAIQGKGSKLIKEVNGDYNNVIGLPLKKFNELLIKSL